jgi:hypothetical protein
LADNPFFPKILNATRLDGLANQGSNGWVWNVGFSTVIEGAYCLTASQGTSFRANLVRRAPAIEQFGLLAVISKEVPMDEPEDVLELERKIAQASRIV